MPATPQFKMKAATLPLIRLIGVHVKTDMNKSAEDCPALWHDVFTLKAHDLMEDNTTLDTTYGLSVMDGGEYEFTYWATLPWAHERMPDGFASIDIPAGNYIKCDVSGLDELAAAYMAMFSHIESAGLEMRMDAPSIEEYGSDYAATGALTLYMPIIKR